jgi:hypothetical protein
MDRPNRVEEEDVDETFDLKALEQPRSIQVTRFNCLGAKR